jgi:hypothetical protein
MRRGLTLVVLTVLVAGTAGCSGSGSGSAASTVSEPVTQSATSSTPAASPSTSPSTAASPKPTPFKTTSDVHSQPWNNKNADFGWVSHATIVSGGVTFRFDRAEWLLPSQVKAWNKANPTHQVTAEDDYAIGNVSSRKRTFFMKTGAQVFGSVMLSGDVAPAKITTAQFAARINSAGGDGVTCWLFHQYGGLTGDVVQLEEQYRP